MTAADPPIRRRALPCYVAALVVAAAAAAALGPSGTASARPFTIQPLVLAGAFLLVELAPVRFELRADVHAFSFAELVLVVGLIGSPPRTLLALRLLASLLGFLRLRLAPVKATVNLAVQALETVAAVATWRRRQGHGEGS
jgi:hypothetical protein